MGESVDPLLDPATLGRRIKAARALGGFKSGGEVVDELAALGVDVSRRSYYAWEAADWTPPLDAFLALVLVLDPPGGLHWFAEAFRPDIAQRLNLTDPPE